MSPAELARERELHLARMRAKYAKEPPTTKGYRGRQRMAQNFGRKRNGAGNVRVRFDDDYLPPDDLTVPHRRCR